MIATRRTLLRLLGGMPLAAVAPSFAGTVPEAAIGSLIAAARARNTVSERMEFISRALLGVKYRENTLIGSATQPEVFVVRDDAFDCVTFCEFVLAAALARDFKTFEMSLRHIRYDQGRVQWNRRNHLFADWCQRNVDNGLCTRVDAPASVPVEKTMDAVGAPGKRHWTLSGIPPKALLANPKLLAAGDIVGFVSRRPSLDYFHTGLIAFGRDGGVLLRNASQSHRRVFDQKLSEFVAQYGTRYVTLLRPSDNPPPLERL